MSASRLFIVATVTTVLLATVVESSAQVRVRDHRKKSAPALTIENFSPIAGQPGTQVEITGRGFTRKTKIVFGGRLVKPTRVTDTLLRFRVPAKADDGGIVLRHPGIAKSLRVGTFQLQTPLTITALSPAAGVTGSRVEIRGTGFSKDARVHMGKEVLAVRFLSEGTLLATIPPGAITAPIVVDVGEQTTQSPMPFTVRRPAPIITRIEPDHGPAGAAVRILGAHFAPADAVYYGKTPVQITARSEGHLDVSIPNNATRSEAFSITGPNGHARTQNSFGLHNPPRIIRLVPGFARSGERLAIHGGDFRAGDHVILNGQAVHINQLRANQITVTLPAGATTGYVVVERKGLRATSPEPLEIVHPPRIDRLVPPHGQPGAQITVHGQWLTSDVAVFYGAQNVKLTRRDSDNAFEFRIPRRAHDQVVSVKTRGGQAASAEPFRVHVYPSIKKISPESGRFGARITLLGKHMTFLSHVFLGKTELPIVHKDKRAVIVEVPPGAKAGRIGFRSFERDFTTRLLFAVLSPPVLNRFTPSHGPAGSAIELEGAHFTDKTVVYFGDIRLELESRPNPQRLVVRLPLKIAGTEPLWIEDAGTRVRSLDAFKIDPPTPGEVKVRDHRKQKPTDRPKVKVRDHRKK